MNDNEFLTDEERRKKTAENIKGIAFLIFFLSMMGAITVTASTGHTALCAVCFGLLFFVAGIFAFCSPKPSLKNAPALIFSVIGAGIIVLPLLVKYTDIEENIPDEIIPYIVVSAFLIIGLCFLIFPTVSFVHKKNTYTPVMAVCRELDMRWSRSKNGGRRRVYAPTWEYYFDGQYYTVKSNSYSNIDVPKEGEEYELLINPDEPEKFFRPSMKTLIFFWFFGGMWTFIPLMILFTMFNG